MAKKRKLKQTLQNAYPEIARQWHPTKNGLVSPGDIASQSNKSYWWKCDFGHEWQATCGNRTKGRQGCPFCSGKRVTSQNSLTTTHPDLIKEWHPTKNGNLKPDSVTSGSNKRVRWLCKNGHEYITKICHRTSGSRCPYCYGKKLSQERSLGYKRPDLAKEFHPTKNESLDPYQVHCSSRKMVSWICSIDPNHEWQSTVDNRNKGNGCPDCSNKRVSKDNSLAMVNPELIKEWHPTKNGNLSPYDIVAGSNKVIWWLCINGHEWSTKAVKRTGSDRTGCPHCNSGWTIEKLRLFVSSILPHIHTLTPAGLFVLLQQTGILNSMGKGRAFIQALKTGKFPKEELEKFVNKEPSLVDKFIEGQQASLDQSDDDTIEDIIETEHETQEDLHVVETQDILQAFDNKIYSSLDREAVDFFIKEAVARIWQHAFDDEQKAFDQLTLYHGDGLYVQEIKQLFLQDYEGTKNLVIPAGYCSPHEPNLMQKYAAYQVKSRRRVGNWSGTGAGKTLSAILASRVIKVAITIICCPNNVIGVWQKDIQITYPRSIVWTKDLDIALQPNAYHYVILNYDFFQQPKAQQKLKQLLGHHTIDFVIIDEIHYTKQRVVENLSQRKKVLSAFLSEAAVKNVDLHVLGMSATPVINNLFEGKTMIELVTGLHHDDLDTRPTISNCVALYQKFITHGFRWLPHYDYTMNVITESIDCSAFIPEIKQLKRKGSMVVLEAILTRAKLPYILDKLKPKTIMYTYYVQDILIPLQNAIEQRGWKVALFTGETKDDLESFITSDIDVLIVSSCAGTGIDGLQKVCNRLIINTLPWTHAEFEQLKGRLYRPGQQRDHVDIFVPLTYAEVNGERWSWCESRWSRIQFKKSIADAAVDGVIPEGHLRTPAQAYQDTMAWLERLDQGNVHEIEREKIYIRLADDDAYTALRTRGDLSTMNQQINREVSTATYQRFNANPKEWEYYHAQYRENRKDWQIVPYQEAIKWCKARQPHLVIGDFGCGEAFLASELINQVHSFDHVAINEKVIAGDMAHVPLDDASLDVAVFSLSLMGTNFVDYLKEAHRCLKLDGHLWIAEPTSRIVDINTLKELLERLGFDIRYVHKKWKFTFIEALKSEREINAVVLNNLIWKNIFN